MQKFESKGMSLILKVLTCVLICRVVVGVFASYRDYLPPNFESEFLQGRTGYFFGAYQWAFYMHITSGPGSLILGMILLSEKFRRRFTRWHRFLGRVQATNVLLLVTPSGLWMAWHADSGAVAGLGFGTLAVVTAVCIAFGWNAAVKRRFAEHRRWTERCFVLLCSAVVLRFIGGSATVAGVQWEWLYPLSAWASWLAPLMAFEGYRKLMP